MVSKSIRLTKDDAAGIQMIIDSDSRVEKGQSQALYYAFKDAADDIPDWEEVAKEVMRYDTDFIIRIPYGETKSFSVDERCYNIVIESIKEQLNLEQLRASYAARLCILAYLKRKRESEFVRLTTYCKKINATTQSKKTDPVKLFSKIVDLINDDTEESRKLLQEIAKLLGI